MTMSFPIIPATIPHLEEDDSNWAAFVMRFRGAMMATQRWAHFDGTAMRPAPRDAANPTSAEREAMKECAREDVAARSILSGRLPDWVLLAVCRHKTTKARWDALIEEFGHPGNPNNITPEGVAPAEPDSTPGEDANPDTDACAHLDGAGSELSMDGKEDHSLEVEEDGIAGDNASVEGDIGPRVELQDPGVSPLATQEDVGLLTPPSPSPPPTPEAASTQRSPAVNAGTPAIPEPEDRGADLDPPPHDTPLPDEAVEHSNHQSPKQIQAPTEAGGQLESLRGETSRRAMGQTSPAPARARGGKMPVGEAHGHPPDFANPQTPGFIVWEPGSADSKARNCAHQARWPVLDEGVRMRPDPWPNLGVVNASHAPAHCHTPAAPGAPDEEEGHLRAISLHGEHVAERQNRTLLERDRAMGHAIWLPKLPWSCNVGALHPDASQPNTPARERRLEAQPRRRRADPSDR